MTDKARSALDKALSSGKSRIAGIPWYREGDYARIRRIMADGHRHPATWRDWSDIARQRQKEIEAKGIKCLRVVIDPDTFPVWCAERGLNVDAQSRASFAAEQAAAQIGN